jgi:hypothetical protein
MTSFVHPDFRTEHPGVARAEQAVARFKSVTAGFDGARGAASLLLAAFVAALLVVANQVIDTWTDGHLMAAWIGLWTVAFAGLALFATPARKAVRGVRHGLRAWNAARRAAASDRKLWEVALTDARVMADISRAMTSGATRDVRGYY